MGKDFYIDQYIYYLRAERHYSEKTIMVYEPVLEAFVGFVGNYDAAKSVEGVTPNGKSVVQEGKIVTPNGKSVVQEGKIVMPNGKSVVQEGKIVMPNGKSVRQKDEGVMLGGETILQAAKSEVSDDQVFKIDWTAVATEDVREWVVMQMDSGDSPATVNKRLSALRSFYKYLLMRGVVKVDPTRKVVGPKKEKKLPNFVREKDMDRLFDGLMFAEDYVGRRDRLILLLFYSTGMRLSELVGLNLSSVDFFTSTIKVLGKRNKERIVPFGPELKEALDEYLPLREAQPGSAGSAALFIGVRSPRIAVPAVGKIVKHYLSQVTTIQKRSPHVLRHSFATAMLNNGAEIEVVKQLLGHESIATTEIYTHTTFEELKKVYAQAHPRADKDE